MVFETTITAAIFFLITIIHTMINIVFSWEYKKKKTYAVLTSRDGDHTIVRINPNKESFDYKKEHFIIPNKLEYRLKLNNKTYIRYSKGNPTPLLWSSDEIPAIPGDVFNRIVESSSLKLLNTAPLSLDLKKILIIAGIILLVVLLFSSGIFTGGEAAPAASNAAGA